MKTMGRTNFCRLALLVSSIPVANVASAQAVLESKQDKLRFYLSVDKAEENDNTTADELISFKRIQGHEVTKMHALMNSVSHFQGHVQEIICLTRQQLGSQYRFEWSPQTNEEEAS